MDLEEHGGTAGNPAGVREPAGGPALRLEVISSAVSFDALRGEWDRLLEQSEARIFQTFEWQRTWWRHYGEGRKSMRLRILLVRDGEELIGIAPFSVETVNVVWPVRYRLMAFTGRGPSDYLDLLARRGREEEVADTVAGYLVEQQETYDVLLLEEIRDTSACGARLAEGLRERGLAVDRFISEQCPRLVMAGTFEETTRSFSKSKRQRMLKAYGALMSDFAAEYESITDGNAVPAAMNEFIEIHQSRWNTVGHAGVFSDTAADGFHREVAPALFARDWLMLTFLRVRGERLAGDYGLRFRGEFMTYLGGARGGDDFLRLSPGRALLLEIMRRGIPEGIRVFDFMRGTERYKYEMGGTDVPNWTIMAFSRHGRLSPILHRAALLRASLTRRTAHEWLHLTHHARKHGVVSKGFARYLFHRTGTVLGDGLQKLRTPEKTVIMGKSDE